MNCPRDFAGYHIRLSTGMVLIIHTLKVLFNNLGIDLSRRNIAMTKHFLKRMEISTVLKQMSSKAVTQGVRGDILTNLSSRLIVFDNLPETLTGHPLTA